MMTPMLTQILVLVVLLLLVLVAVQKASEEGFFTSLCTMGVLYAAYRFAYLQWEQTYELLARNLDIDTASAVSASYWIGFFLVILPGMLYVRLLTREKVPFPRQIERWGSMLVGAVSGLLLFGVVANSLTRFGFYEGHLQVPMRNFRVLLDLIEII